jgi:uncharacterized protein with ParB-like and HNH nuclease domain
MSFQPAITVSDIIAKIDYDQCLLPAIQREFVWKHQNIELLFDSLMRDYPIGSLLFWRVEQDTKADHRFYTVLKKFRERYHSHCPEINTQHLHSFEAILDGQQRLTALYIGLKGTYAYKVYRRKWIDNDHSLPNRRLYLKLNELAPQDDLESDVNEDGRLYDFRFLTKQIFGFQLGKS